MITNSRAVGIEIKPATDAELRELWGTVPCWIIPGGNANNARYLHLPDPNNPDKPRCRRRMSDWRTKDRDVYPLDFKPICKNCLDDWREYR